MGRATKLEIEARVDHCYRMLLGGMTSIQIVQYGAKKWPVKDRMVYKYIKRAQEKIREDAKDVRQNALEEALLARRQLRAMSEDFAFRLEVLQDEAKLLGLYSPERRQVEHSGSMEMRSTIVGTPVPPGYDPEDWDPGDGPGATEDGSCPA